jgi:death-on-curing protein
VTAYLEIEDALQVVDRYGFHIRDIGLLASALARPATTVGGVEAYPQLAMKAAALLESVARFHPLIDGYKRTAWTLMVLMLWINGFRHDFSTDDAFDLVVGVAAGDISLEDRMARASATAGTGPGARPDARITFLPDDVFTRHRTLEVANEVFAAMKSFFIEWHCWTLHPPSLAGGVDHIMDGANPAVVPAQQETAFPQWGSAVVVWCAQKGELRVWTCPHSGLRIGSDVGRFGSDSACFREFPVFARPGRQFESHLGHSVSAGQKLFLRLVLTNLDKL